MKIPVAEPDLGKKELSFLLSAFKSGWISSKGDFINKFETSFAKYCGTKYASSCNNGTSALHLALLAFGIKEGDEVILPTLTYIATANAIKYVGAKPIFIDSEKGIGSISPKEIEKKITKKTKAIIAVHLYGIPCDMNKIMTIARKNKLYVIEDCAEAHGAEYSKKKVGSIGDIGCFSFFGNKIITTGEGGMCTSNKKWIKDKIDLFKNQGNSKTKFYFHDVIGYNYRMTNLQAAIGLAQLKRINYFIRKRKSNQKIYSTLLNLKKGISFLNERKNSRTVYWMHSILIKNKRDKLMKELKKKGIETRPFFSLITKMSPYYSKEKFPNAEELSTLGLNLPSSVKLKEIEIRKICSFIKRGIK